MVESAVKACEEFDDWHRAVEDWINAAAILDESLERGMRSGFSKVPREQFLSHVGYRERYCDDCSAIGDEQVLYRPTVLIRMCALVEARKRARILVMGAGSGYLCAVLDVIGAQVFGIERVVSMAQATRKNLDKRGHHAVWIQSGDATKGWDDASPFDALICCYPIAQEAELPLHQMANGGLAVAPLQSHDGIRLALWEQSAGRARRTIFEKVETS
jgi:protein-L-isoaspartate(D-aspartate) O-methyltransferase